MSRESKQVKSKQTLSTDATESINVSVGVIFIYRNITKQKVKTQQTTSIDRVNERKNFVRMTAAMAPYMNMDLTNKRRCKNAGDYTKYTTWEGKQYLLHIPKILRD